MIALDTLLFNAQIADVFLLRVLRGWIGIKAGRFLYVEEGDPPEDITAKERSDLGGALVVPGLIDAHMHIESSLLTPGRFAQAAVPHGTTAVLADPHEVANVAGASGVRWMVERSRDLPLYVRYALPSCVPATSPELEWTAQVFGSEMVREFSSEPQIAALGEVMDYRRVLDEMSASDAQPVAGVAADRPPSRPNPPDGGANLSEMMETARSMSLLVEGHVPTLAGRELSEYLYHGVGSDHTLTNPAKLREQLSKGLCVMLQAKSLTEEVARAVMSLEDRSRILLVTDDIEASLLRSGHMSLILKRAMASGIAPLEAIASATIRPARYLGFDRGVEKRGAVAPGWTADFLVLGAIDQFPPRLVYVRGKVAARNGAAIGRVETRPASGAGERHLLPDSVGERDIAVAGRSVRSGRANVVVIDNERTSLTRLEQIPLELDDGFPVWPSNEDLACVTIVARDGSRASTGVVKNLGLRRGAFAASFAHDSHNLLIIGRRREEMVSAANEVIRRRGALVVQEGGRIAAALDLPVFGLLSDEPFDAVADALAEVERELSRLGMTRERPFLMLSLLSLSVSPLYKFSDRGIVDTEARRLLPPFVAEGA